jgi:hypothetical protein
MTVEDLIEALREMPPTSRVEIDCGQLPADFMDEDDVILADPVSVAYSYGTTTIKGEI